MYIYENISVVCIKHLFICFVASFFAYIAGFIKKTDVLQLIYLLTNSSIEEYIGFVYLFIFIFCRFY